jgi:hypothetical protein
MGPIGWIGLLGLVVGGIGWLIASSAQETLKGRLTTMADQNLERMQRAFQSLPNFTPTHSVVAFGAAVVLDAQRRLVGWPSEANIDVACVYPFADVLHVQLIQDGVTVSRVSRGGQLAGAAIGAALAGPVGAIIGGTTAATTTSTENARLQLHITVKDLDRPLHRLHFPTGEAFASELERAREIMALFEVVIRDAEESDAGR